VKSGAALKAWLRKELYARRKAAHSNAATKDPLANERLLALIGAPGDKVVAGYRPIRSEIDPTPAMIALCEAGVRVAVPVIEAKDSPLLFHEWSPGCEMVEGAFGAEVPAKAIKLLPEILITPLVGWDRQGWRLGYGGGFYDRSLEQLRIHRPVRAIGFAYVEQEIGETPRESTDQRLDAIVTDKEVVDID
jgi:5-formyltetrahydrofolate cyclo-ligase